MTMDEIRVRNVTRVTDRALSLPMDRRGYFALTATNDGPKVETGLRLWKTDKTDASLAAYVSNGWTSIDPQWGTRFEVRF